jgi:hypothetical protein
VKKKKNVVVGGTTFGNIKTKETKKILFANETFYTRLFRQTGCILIMPNSADSSFAIENFDNFQNNFENVLEHEPGDLRGFVRRKNRES